MKPLNWRALFGVALSLCWTLAAANSPEVKPVENMPGVNKGVPDHSPAEESTLKPTSELESSLQDFLKLRDPFKRPNISFKNTITKSVLESFQLTEFKMVGVLTGPYQTRAMVVDPQGKAHFIGLNSKIGIYQGKVIQIASDRIKVREKIPNLMGQIETFDSEIFLQSEGKLGSAPQSAIPEGVVQ